jgi:hypothetical protein
MNYYKQIDTGRVYQVTGKVINKTTGNENQTMILYVDPLDTKKHKTVYSMCILQFNREFIACNQNGYMV